VKTITTLPTRRGLFERARNALLAWWWTRLIAQAEGNNVYLERQIAANNRDIDRMRIELARLP
jgi:hypothetical protein